MDEALELNLYLGTEHYLQLLTTETQQEDFGEDPVCNSLVLIQNSCLENS